MSSQWSVDLETIAQRAGVRVEDAARKVTFEVFRAVVLRSPVDTGRFRANWNVSAGSPDASTTTATEASRADQEVGKALALPVGGVVYLSNGLPYGPRLEHGYSGQAPQGMIKVTVAELSQHIAEATKGAQ